MAVVDGAIVCACLPTFRPLFDGKVRGKRRGSVESQIIDLMQDPSLSQKDSPSQHGNGGHAVGNRLLNPLHKTWAKKPLSQPFNKWVLSNMTSRGIEVKKIVEHHYPLLVIDEHPSENGSDTRNQRNDFFTLVHNDWKVLPHEES